MILCLSWKKFLSLISCTLSCTNSNCLTLLFLLLKMIRDSNSQKHQSKSKDIEMVGSYHENDFKKLHFDWWNLILHTNGGRIKTSIQQRIPLFHKLIDVFFFYFISQQKVIKLLHNLDKSAKRKMFMCAIVLHSVWVTHAFTI